MKRILSLLAALMCLSVSSVWAQNATTSLGTVDTDVTAIQNLESGYYVIQATAENHVGYIYYNGNAAPANAGAGVIRMYYGTMEKDTIGTHGSLAYVWHVTHLADKKQLVIRCAGNDGFWPNSSVNEDKFSKAKTVANAAVYTYPSEINPNVGVRLYQVDAKLDGQDIYVHKSNIDGNNNEFHLSYWNGSGNADGSKSACCFKFYKFTLAEGVSTNETAAVPVTYTQQIDGKNTGVTITNKVTYVGTVTSPWEYSNGVFTPSFTPQTIDVNTGSVIVNFVKNTSPRVNMDEYYKLKFKDNFRVVVGGNVETADNSSKNDFANYYNPNKYWKFVTDGLQVKMVCGDGKYVHLSNPVNVETEKATFVEGAENGTKFYLNNSTNASYSDGFVLKYANNTYLGDHANPPAHSLGTWNHTNAASGGGSCFAVDGYAIGPHDLAVLYTRINETQPDLASNVLRVANSEQVEEANKKWNELHALASEMTPKDLVDVYNIAFTAQPETGAYYRIKNLGASTNIYPSTINIEANTVGEIPSTNDDARVFELKTASDAMAPQLWQFVANGDGTFKIKNANTNCAWANQTATGKNFDMTTAENTDVHAGNFSILAVPVSRAASEGTIASVNNGVSTFLIRNGLSAVKATDDAHLQLAESGATYSDNVNYWQIEKVTSIPVNITAAKYATVGYPFNVKVTDDKVRVYYAKEATNGVMKLTEATDKIIPANQGAILYYEGEGSTTANLDIVSERGAGFVDNILTASTAKRTGFATKTTYGLSNKDGKVSFRLNTDTYVPANKSYLLATNYSSGSGSAQQLLFSFDNVVEGIDNAVVDGQNANKVYYDLQGRRVMYPAHGIFVTENGEKVFIK